MPTPQPELSRRRHFLALVERELDQQDEKWGAGRDLPPDKWIRIAVEELGEAAAEIERRDWQALLIEAVQTAAVMIQMCESVHRQEGDG